MIRVAKRVRQPTDGSSAGLLGDPGAIPGGSPEGRVGGDLSLSAPAVPDYLTWNIQKRW
jgi:hypothetical protein